MTFQACAGCIEQGIATQAPVSVLTAKAVHKMVKEFTEGHRYSAIQKADKKPRSRKTARKGKDHESDEHRLAQRAKQIAYGENTPGYGNFTRALESDSQLLKGCLPVKPSLHQKCSKRSWDGQIRKWRRALHMYDFVDFGDSQEQAEAVRQALIDQNRNPLFTASTVRVLPDGSEVTLLPHTATHSEVRLPEAFDPTTTERVRYSFDDLFELSNSSLVAPYFELPENLHFLDKRVDLEDDYDEDTSSAVGTPETHPEARPPWLSPFTPGYSPASDVSSVDDGRRVTNSGKLLGTPVRLFLDATEDTAATSSTNQDAVGRFGPPFAPEAGLRNPWFSPFNPDSMVFPTEVCIRVVQRSSRWGEGGGHIRVMTGQGGMNMHDHHEPRASVRNPTKIDTPAYLVQ